MSKYKFNTLYQIEPSSYNIVYDSIDGFSTPSSINITLLPGSSKIISAYFEELEKVDTLLYKVNLEDTITLSAASFKYKDKNIWMSDSNYLNAVESGIEDLKSIQNIKLVYYPGENWSLFDSSIDNTSDLTNPILPIEDNDFYPIYTGIMISTKNEKNIPNSIKLGRSVPSGVVFNINKFNDDDLAKNGIYEFNGLHDYNNLSGLFEDRHPTTEEEKKIYKDIPAASETSVKPAFINTKNLNYYIIWKSDESMQRTWNIIPSAAFFEPSSRIIIPGGIISMFYDYKSDDSEDIDFNIISTTDAQYSYNLHKNDFDNLYNEDISFFIIGNIETNLKFNNILLSRCKFLINGQTCWSKNIIDIANFKNWTVDAFNSIDNNIILYWNIDNTDTTKNGWMLKINNYNNLSTSLAESLTDGFIIHNRINDTPVCDTTYQDNEIKIIKTTDKA